MVPKHPHLNRGSFALLTELAQVEVAIAKELGLTLQQVETLIRSDPEAQND